MGGNHGEYLQKNGRFIRQQKPLEFFAARAFEIAQSVGDDDERIHCDQQHDADRPRERRAEQTRWRTVRIVVDRKRSGQGQCRRVIHKFCALVADRFSDRRGWFNGIHD